jgi:hypothetical protein
MSETLPFALDRLRDIPEEMGVDIDEIDEEQRVEMLAVFEDLYQEMRPVFTQLVRAAYDVPRHTVEEWRRDAISDFENDAFSACFEGYEEEAANSDDLTEADIDASAEAAYMYAIRQRISRNWVKPPTATDGIECVISIRQLPGGEVVSVSIGTCNGDSAVRRSIESAVHRASPLPSPSDPGIFDPDISLTFRPDD